MLQPLSLNGIKDDDTLRERMREQGMNEDDIRRRDEEAKIFESTVRMQLEGKGWRTHVDLMLEISGKK